MNSCNIGDNACSSSGTLTGNVRCWTWGNVDCIVIMLISGIMEGSFSLLYVGTEL